MSSPDQYGQISFRQKLKVHSLTMVVLPLYSLWIVITYPFSPNLRKKTLKLAISHAQTRFATDNFSVAELQFIAGLSVNIYKKWAQKNKLPVDIEDLPEEGARLLWIGPKRTDKVIFYCHGGGFVLPFWDSFLTFWRHAQVELESKNIHIGIAVMSYNLIPPGKFPSQLREAKSGLEHLFKSGVKPENILVAGDSAGGNLVLQIFSHILHPLASVERINLPSATPSRFRGAFISSPWLSPSGDIGMGPACNNETDILSANTIRAWGTIPLEGVPEADMVYIEPSKAPKTWFSGIEKVTERILLTSGGAECVTDSHVLFYEEHMKEQHPDVKFVVQKDGVHDSALFKLALEKRPVQELAGVIVDWVGDTFGEGRAEK
ncbi:Alpha/Beta hydrolase protein [Desarmillaria tabescens]|uniref:Alpha/Beta hydrolase protein n=1 Tax=Armillaria tabescens TaxID=1929756 RepID=A0AA39KAF1_ARMTA|nr:Alpha/Beta hydrolase protein [Desarmillaria tabescens]KAK0457465.1 Alpha/Beta hydrolase protein [Desarmillaria tabescens]